MAETGFCSEITADTELDDIISVSNVTTKLDSAYRDIKTNLEELSEQVSNEISTGGFSQNAYYVNGKYGINDEANEVVTSISDFIENFTSIRSNAIKLARTQRVKELTKLKEALEKEITALESKIKYVQELNGQQNASGGGIGVWFELEDTDKNYNNYIANKDKYAKKLKSVESLLSNVSGEDANE